MVLSEVRRATCHPQPLAFVRPSTLKALFSGSAPGVLAAARQYVAVLESLGDVQVLPQKTRLVAVARVRFAGLYPRKDDVVGMQRSREAERPSCKSRRPR